MRDIIVDLENQITNLTWKERDGSIPVLQKEADRLKKSYDSAMAVIDEKKLKVKEIQKAIKVLKRSLADEQTGTKASVG